MGLQKHVLGVGPKAFEVQTWDGAGYKFEATVMRRQIAISLAESLSVFEATRTRVLDHDNGGITVCIWDAGKPQEPGVLL